MKFRICVHLDEMHPEIHYKHCQVTDCCNNSDFFVECRFCPICGIDVLNRKFKSCRVKKRKKRMVK